MGDEDLLGTIIEGFLSDIPQEIKLLRDAIQNGNALTVVEQAHKIKGAAGNISGYCPPKSRSIHGSCR